MIAAKNNTQLYTFMNKALFALATAMLLSFAAIAQEKIPILTGTMILSVKEGTMECEFTLKDMPLVKDYLILINTGMNIRSVRNARGYGFSYRRIYPDTITDESFGYYIPDNTGKAKHMPDELQFSYVGKFPVVADTLNPMRSDWKGNIAFNGYSVRADGAQAKWYPVLYDMTKDISYSEVKYDITIQCKDCDAIYVNGTKPVVGQTANLKTETPTELMLYAGKYKVEQVDGTYFLNPDIDAAQMKAFGEMTKNYKSFYEKKLGIPYKETITYINTTPVSKYNAWMFVSYPSIVNVGWDKYGMKSFFDERRAEITKTFIAHELGHYYFGHYKSFNAGLGDACSEGFAEFLSLQVAQEFQHDSVYTKKFKSYVVELEEMEMIPFAKIASTNDYGNRQLYVYNYVPLILCAIQKEIGSNAMWLWLKTILNSKTEMTTYSFVRETLQTALKDDKKLQQLETKYFMSDASVRNAITTLGL
jgi:hypothetical protein